MIKVILKFGLVGILNTLIDYGVLQILVIFFGVNILLANTISSTLGTINSFILNKTWTFQDKNERFIMQFIVFAVINAVAISINDFTLLSLNRITPQYFSIFHHAIRSILITKLGAILVTMIFNFIVYRILVFNPKLKIYSKEVIVD